MIAQIVSYKTIFFNVVSTINDSFLPAINKSQYVMLIKICTSWCDSLLKSSTHHLTVLTPAIWSPKMFSKCQGMSVVAIFFSAERNSLTHLCFICTSMSKSFCQTAPLLPSIAWQQDVTNLTQYGWMNPSGVNAEMTGRCITFWKVRYLLWD